jgi:3-oxoacyl-[acyl-carrier protein] reductase
MAQLESVTEEHFHKHFDLNVPGVLLTAREALKYFGPGGKGIRF